MNEPKAVIPFTPIPVRARHDGWTVEKQYSFIEALAETGIVEEACRRVGMSDTSAYNLRRRPCGAPFRRAWEAAIDYSLHRIEEDAFNRSRRGVARPIFYKGEQIGEWRHYDERLTMFLLRARRPQRYGKWIERMLAPGRAEDEGDGYEDPAIALDGGLSAIEFDATDVPPEKDAGDEQCAVNPPRTRARALRSKLSQLPARRPSAHRDPLDDLLLPGNARAGAPRAFIPRPTAALSPDRWGEDALRARR